MNLDAETLKAIAKMKSVLDKLGTKYVLVGALVPSVLLADDLNGSLAPGVRTTKDIDAAMPAHSWAEFKRIKKQLMQEGFVASPNGPEHRLLLGRVEIDLIPAGARISKKRQIVWPESGQSMDITGFSEAFEHAEQAEIVSGQRIPVAPLWVFAILKVVAYADRNFQRDAYDLVVVLQEYGSKDGRRFENMPSGMTYEYSGAFLCGRDAGKLAHSSTISAVLSHLKEFLSGGEYSPIVSAALREAGRLDDEAYRRKVFKLLETFRDGVLAGRSG